MVKSKSISNSQVIIGNSNSTSVQGDSNISVGQVQVMYKKAQVYMVALHEIEDITQEDWFLETINLIAGVVLGFGIERLISSPEISWIVVTIGSIAVLSYRIYRKFKQDKKISEIKKTAVPYTSQNQRNS
jgi:hypothetical protein